MGGGGEFAASVGIGKRDFLGCENISRATHSSEGEKD